jgi:type IV secretory pathway TraG/TraD family ATPase VirD4
VSRTRETRNLETDGSARWAKSREIERSALLGSDGGVLSRCIVQM